MEKALSNKFCNIQYLIDKLNILLLHCDITVDEKELLSFRKHLLNNFDATEPASEYELNTYYTMEEQILSSLTTSERKKVMNKLLALDKKNYKKSNIEASLTEELKNRLVQAEKKLQLLIERPKLYEARAEEKLNKAQQQINQLNKEVNEFLGLLHNTPGIAEQIKMFNKAKNEIEIVKQQAQTALNKIITVSIAEHYQTAKKEYALTYNKMQFNVHKNIVCRIFINFILYIWHLLKHIFQKDVLLYVGFILSLLMLTLSYLTLIILDSTSYKDLALTLPLIWLAWFFQRKINTREKLYEIYNHKQKVIETYIAFMNSEYTIKSNDNFEEIILSTIKKDPSNYIGKDNSTLIEAMLDKLKGLFLSSQIKRNICQDNINKDNIQNGSN